MKTLARFLKHRAGGLALLGVCAALACGAGQLSSANDADYGSRTFGGNSYAQNGPGPAYGGAYAAYAGNANRPRSRFSSTYGEFNAAVGFGRFGGGSSWGSGPLSQAGTGPSAAPGNGTENAGGTTRRNPAVRRIQKSFRPRLPF